MTLRRSHDAGRGHGLGPVPPAAETFADPQDPGGSVGTMRCVVLDNGAQVLSEHIPGVRSIATGVWIRQGAAHETPEHTGVSHLLEHMVFKGTERRSAHEIADAVEALGGSLDAYTSREHTAYQARVLDEHLPEALDVLSDLVLRPRLDEGDLELEREVILEEIAQVEDTPDDLVFELHADRLWRGHPYGRSILGTQESVTAIPGETLRRLHRERYVGRNLVVAAAGSVAHDDFVHRVEELFGAVPAGRRVASVQASRGTASGAQLVGRDSAQTHIVFGTEGPAHASDDRFPLILLSSALGGGMSSRLFQRVREELGLCYAIYTYQSFYRAAGVFGVYVGSRPATAARASDVVREELSVVARDGLSQDALERIKRQVKGQVMLSLESTGSRLYRLASFALHDQPFLGLGGLLEKVDAVTLDDVRRVATRHLDPEGVLELRLGPEAGD